MSHRKLSALVVPFALSTALAGAEPDPAPTEPPAAHSGAVGTEVTASGVRFRTEGFGGALCWILVKNTTGKSAYITCARTDGGTFNDNYCAQWVQTYAPQISQEIADRLDVGFENGEEVYANPNGNGNVKMYLAK
ncbi:MAG: hypothetical protein KDG50_07525 [Chromatiales bacterium]|nr:hypothetical protein [Chromatiales bacterium]